MMELPAEALRGSYPPLVTPFRDGEVDHDAYAALVRQQVEGGSRGIVVNGTTAEPSTLTVAERSALVLTAVEAAGGQLTVVAATGSQSFAETAQLTRDADEAGADAMLVVTPYYSRPPQRGLVEYFRGISKLTERPVLLYHIPGRAAVSVEIDTLEQMSEAAPNLVGMKHASTDLSLVTDALTRLGREFRIFVGLEELTFPMLALGAGGAMNAVGNIAPGKVAALCRYVEEGDLDAARELHFELFDLNRAVFWDINPIPMKYLMKRQGILERNEHRLPMMAATPELEKRLDDLVDHIIRGGGALS